MTKIKITSSSQVLSTFSIPVRINDINYGNHVGNNAFVGIIHEARVQWLRQYNYSEINIDGVGLIMSELNIQFKKESFYGDIIIVKIFSGEITKVAFDLIYELSTNRNNEHKVLALASTTMVCYNYATKKIASIPDKLKNILQD